MSLNMRLGMCLYATNIERFVDFFLGLNCRQHWTYPSSNDCFLADRCLSQGASIDPKKPLMYVCCRQMLLAFIEDSD